METNFSVVLVPHDELIPIVELNNVEIDAEIEPDPAERINVLRTLLVRDRPMLYSHHRPHTTDPPNIRATRVGMVCGLFGIRFRGDVVLSLDREHLRVKDIRIAATTVDVRGDACIPFWLSNANRSHFRDIPVLKELANVMSPKDEESSTSSSGGSDHEEDVVSNHPLEGNELVTTVPLCIECRRPTDMMCSDCLGVYFCGERCRSIGWSHQCLCSAFRTYTDRRNELASVELGDWSVKLSGRPFQLSEEPYEIFLARDLGVVQDHRTWWTTETKGWRGGESESAEAVDINVRRTYAEGFCPLRSIPFEGPVTTSKMSALERNDIGFISIKSWLEYYNLRDLPLESPVALLLTFPLTLHLAIVEYGTVPCTVAKMLRRPLRVHIVGAEKEMNFLDLFQEVSFLLPSDFQVELVFVVRPDMLPAAERSSNKFHTNLKTGMSVFVTSGKYGSDLDPKFDCGTGPPDMVVAFNAGLYAYDSWNSVVQFLDDNKGIVGVFTDYNEYSGVQCASLGGALCRESLTMNPFRQPRAMPVYSMNLPQYSNGFLYVFNEQNLE